MKNNSKKPNSVSDHKNPILEKLEDTKETKFSIIRKQPPVILAFYI